MLELLKSKFMIGFIVFVFMVVMVEGKNINLENNTEDLSSYQIVSNYGN